MTDTTTILSLEDLKRRRDERDRIDAELSSLEARYQTDKQALLSKRLKADRWLEAVAVILGEEGNDAAEELLSSRTTTVQAKISDTKPMTLIDAIMSLDGWDKGMRSRDVIGKLRKDPEMSARTGSLSKQTYTNLGRLVDRGMLVKEGDLYKTPSKQNEPPVPESADGSESGSVNGSDPSLDFNPARPVH